MADYGHNLEFGYFLDPGSREPERTLDIAQRVDALGYDLIGIQDHPYRAGPLRRGRAVGLHPWANRAGAPLPGCCQPADAAPGGPRQNGGHARPVERGTRRAWARGGGVLGCDPRSRWSAAQAESGAGCARRGGDRDSRDVERPTWHALRRRALPASWRPRRTRAGPRDRHLARRRGPEGARPGGQDW